MEAALGLRLGNPGQLHSQLGDQNPMPSPAGVDGDAESGAMFASMTNPTEKCAIAVDVEPRMALGVDPANPRLMPLITL